MSDAQTGRDLKQKGNLRLAAVILAALFVLAAFVVWPQIDLVVSALFYTPDEGFVLASHPLFLFMRDLAYYAARVLGVVLLLLVLFTELRKKPLAGINAKGWLFLWLGLLLAPGLIANVVFKDHWGRARPREVVEFGGAAPFSPALIPQKIKHRNSSFISGDASFGFYLPGFAYVVPRRSLRRRFFWGGIGAGTLFGLSRLFMGAHFLSDILFAAFFTLAAVAALHAVMFGRRETATLWRHWLFNLPPAKIAEL